MISAGKGPGTNFNGLNALFSEVIKGFLKRQATKNNGKNAKFHSEGISGVGAVQNSLRGYEAICKKKRRH